MISPLLKLSQAGSINSIQTHLNQYKYGRIKICWSKKVDLLIVGESGDSLSQAIVNAFAQFGKNAVILDVLSAAQLFTVEIIRGKVIVTPDLPIILRVTSPQLIRNNFDETFQYEEALSTLWAVATACNSPVLNRPNPRTMWGEVALSAVLTQVRAHITPDTQEVFSLHPPKLISNHPQQQWYLQDLGTYKTTEASEIPPGNGPFRSRLSLAKPGYEIVVVLANRAWRTTQVTLEHLELEQQSISLLRSLNLNFGIVIWSINNDCTQASIARIESFPTFAQVELIWSELALSLYEVLCPKST